MRWPEFVRFLDMGRSHREIPDEIRGFIRRETVNSDQQFVDGLTDRHIVAELLSARRSVRYDRTIASGSRRA